MIAPYQMPTPEPPPPRRKKGGLRAWWDDWSGFICGVWLFCSMCYALLSIGYHFGKMKERNRGVTWGIHVNPDPDPVAEKARQWFRELSIEDNNKKRSLL